jgi:hypothetical protein
MICWEPLPSLKQLLLNFLGDKWLFWLCLLHVGLDTSDFSLNPLILKSRWRALTRLLFQLVAPSKSLHGVVAFNSHPGGRSTL